MKKKIRVFAGVLSAGAFLFSGPAKADFKCSDLDDLKSSVNDCEDNQTYVDAAQDCLKNYEKLVKARTASLSKSMGGAGAKLDKAGNSQTGDYSNSGADYQLSTQTLAELVAKGEKVSEVIEDYLNNIVYPEEFDAPKQEIGDPEEYLSNSQCYSRARKGIEGLLDRLDGKLDELDDAKDAATAMKAKAALQQANTGTLNSQPAVQGGQGQGSGTPKAGTSGNGTSDVTGVQQDKAKQSQQ